MTSWSRGSYLIYKSDVLYYGLAAIYLILPNANLELPEGLMLDRLCLDYLLWTLRQSFEMV